MVGGVAVGAGLGRGGGCRASKAAAAESRPRGNEDLEAPLGPASPSLL